MGFHKINTIETLNTLKKDVNILLLVFYLCWLKIYGCTGVKGIYRYVTFKNKSGIKGSMRFSYTLK